MKTAVTATKTDGRKLPRHTLEAIRREAIKRVDNGESPESVIRSLGLHRSRIYAWLKMYREQGESALKNKHPGGRSTKLSDAQLNRLLKTIDGKTPEALGLHGRLWSADSLQKLIAREFTLSLGKTAVSRLLKRWRFDLQRPHNKLFQQGYEAKAWLHLEYAKLQRQAFKAGSKIFFIQLVADTFFVATSARGAAHFMHYKKITPSGCTAFLRQLLRDNPDRRLVLLAFNDSQLTPILNSHTVKRFSGAQADRLSLQLLPSFKPIRNTQQLDTRLQTPLLTDIEAWALLLNQSLTDVDFPFNSFLQRLFAAVQGPTVIAANLHRPASMIRAYPNARYAKDAASLERWSKHNQSMSHTWQDNPFLAAFKKPGDIMTLRELVPFNQWKNNTYCTSHLLSGMSDVLGMCFAGPEDSLCGLFLSQAQGNVSSEIKTFLQQLRPHLETAITLAVGNWRNTFTVTALSEATDHLGIAAFVLDGNGQVIQRNASAKKLLERKAGLFTAEGELRFEQQHYQKKFRQAFDQAIKWRQAPLGDKPVAAMKFVSTREPAALQNRLNVLVQPITPPSMAIPLSVAVSPHVVVYINEPGRTPTPMHHQLLEDFFDLSHREAYLTTLLVRGESIDNAATIMNITKASARTYLQHIYEKVGVNRRQDLVQQVMKSLALLA